MKSIVHNAAKMPRVETAKKSNAMLQSSTPIWLNSFLSLFVPSCYMRTLDPAILNDDINRKAFFEAEKTLQRKVIRLQVLTSTTILLAATELMFFLVQFTDFRYNNNILNNYSFIIACATIIPPGSTPMLLSNDKHLRLHYIHDIHSDYYSWNTIIASGHHRLARSEEIFQISTAQIAGNGP